MTYINLSARVPDDENYMVIYEISPDAERRLIGYIKSSTWYNFMDVARKFTKFWESFLES